jgi:hypothetical protein
VLLPLSCWCAVCSAARYLEEQARTHPYHFIIGTSLVLAMLYIVVVKRAYDPAKRCVTGTELVMRALTRLQPFLTGFLQGVRCEGGFRAERTGKRRTHRGMDSRAPWFVNIFTPLVCSLLAHMNESTLQSPGLPLFPSWISKSASQTDL